MVTKRNDSTGAAVESVEAARAEIDRMAVELNTTKGELHSERQLREDERRTHLAEMARMTDMVKVLQVRRQHRFPVQTPEAALSYIIGYFENVAVGGPAAGLRKAVQDVAFNLQSEDRRKLREYMTRLRGAAEAADQETADLLL